MNEMRQTMNHKENLQANQQDINDTKQDVANKAEQKPRLSAVVSGANELSVGISIVVAVLLGIGIGILLERLSGYKWTFWLGVVWGVGAAILNLYRAYKRAQKEAQELAQNPRYSYKPDSKDDDEDISNGRYY